MSDARALAIQVAELRRAVRQLQTAAALGSSSIEGGQTLVYDDDEVVRQIIGQQVDGSYGTVATNAPAPVAPSDPIVTAGLATLVVEWDGLTADGSTWPLDFDRVEVHVSTIPAFEPTDATQVHNFHTIKGGSVTLSLNPGTTYYVCLVAVNTSREESDPSGEISATPQELPEGSVPTTPPAASPAITAVKGFTDGLVVRTETVDPSTKIEYHISTVSGFTPDASTLVATSTANVQPITALPDGTRLATGTVYYLVTVATNAIGPAAPSAEVPGVLDTSAVSTIVTAEMVAGFVLAGQIDVGNIHIIAPNDEDPQGGILIETEAGDIRFPADGSAATIAAHLVAKSLTIEDNTMIGGGASIVGTVDLAEGITRPTRAPDANLTHPRVDPTWGDGTVDGRNVFLGAGRGLCPQIGTTDQWVQAIADGNDYSTAYGTVVTVDRATGVHADGYDVSSWGGLIPYGGITAIGSEYFVLGQDPARGGDWYIYALDTSFVKTREVFVFPESGTTSPVTPPAIGNDATADDGGSNIVVGYVKTADEDARVFRMSTAFALVGSEIELSNWALPWYGEIGAVAYGDFDVLTPSIFVAVPSIEYATVYAWHESQVIGRQPELDFKPGSTPMVRGMYWDTTDGCFYVYDAATGAIKQCSKFYLETDVRGAHTWYDGNLDGGEHETEESPTVTITVPPRWWPRFTVPTPPDAAVVDPLLTDLANQARIYADEGATAEDLHLAATIPVGEVSVLLNKPIPTGTATPPLTNSFESADRAPGQFTSSALRQDGQPMTRFDGAGIAWADGLIPPGSMMMWAGQTGVPTPDGWLSCDGQMLDPAAYPDLFAALGTTYGGDGISTFGVPDLRHRFPVGVGSVWGPGTAVAGAEATRVDGYNHTHDHGSGTLANSAPTGIDKDVATGGQAAAHVNHGHNISGSTDIATPPTHPFIVVGFIIKT